MVYGVPVLNVLLYSSVAAAFAGLGVIPFIGGRSPRRLWIGVAYAGAGGMMLGSAHLLMTEGVAKDAWFSTGGVAAGVIYSVLVRALAAIDELDEVDDSGGKASPVRRGPAYGYKIFMQGSLHSGAEGIAIGVAMLLNLRVGIFMALVFALHNIAEGMVLTDTLRTQGLTLRRCAALAVIAKLTQPLMALVVFALHPLLEPLLPIALGFSAGALSFLVLTDLLPASYRRAGQMFIAVTVSVLAAAVVLLEELFLG